MRSGTYYRAWGTFGEVVAVGEETVSINAGACLTIPRGIQFQFRAMRSSPLEVLIGTFPRWPGPHEAIRCKGIWDVDPGS